MQSIILAGGLGTRLRTVVNDKPKVLSPVAGKPFLSYVIDYLLLEGVDQFIFSIGYLSNQIIDFIKSEYPDLNYQISLEDTPLGTGGAIKKSLELATADNVLIVNADTFFKIDVRSMYQSHIAKNADCTMSLKKMFQFDRYGSVELNDGRVICFNEKKYQSEGFINGGYLLIKRKLLASYIELPTIFSIEKDFLEPKMEEILVNGYISDGYFIDIGIPEDFAKAQIDFQNV